MAWLQRLWWNLVRLGFHLLYNQMAFTYDAISYLVSLGEWRTWQRTALNYLPDKPNMTILEIAHGTGNLHLDLHQTTHHIVGCDLSPYMGRITQRKLLKVNHHPALVQANVMQLPFANAKFDVIISTFPTDFITHPTTLGELHRLLKADSIVVVVPNGIITGGGILRYLLEFAYRITGQREKPMLDLAEHFSSYGFNFQQHITVHKYSQSELWLLQKMLF
jgi:ubiquinone/menaquinone biosynthesis C-methylase UbiE